uniref:Uncharacterized protein n=1 Tax=Gasterosteus aculeatus aculeatus TaxID=481459 RepID=G3NR87_GASAC
KRWATSSTRTPLSSAAATTLACAPNAACACRSWTRRPAWPRTTATSGCSGITAAPASQPGRCTRTPPAAGERRDDCTTPRIRAWASTASSSTAASCPRTPCRPRAPRWRPCYEGKVWTKGTTPRTTRRACWRSRHTGVENNSSVPSVVADRPVSVSPPQRVLEADAAEDAFHDDDDDFEVNTPKRRHRGKGRGRGSGRRKADMDDDKPYVCDNRYKQKQNSKSSTSVCAKRYRNRTGLSYHYTHSHLAEEGRGGARSSAASKAPAAQQAERHKRQRGPGGTGVPNNYCTKCQGSLKKTGKSGSPFSTCQCKAGRAEEKDDAAFTGAEELFGTTSESDTSTFHGFEDDELEEPAANGNGISNRHR